MEPTECNWKGCKTVFASYVNRDYCSECQIRADYRDLNNSEPDTHDEREYEETHGDAFERRREWVLSVHRRECFRCGLGNKEHQNTDALWPPGGGLHIHHITDASEFDDLAEAHHTDNLVPLCDGCHKAVTWGYIELND